MASGAGAPSEPRSDPSERDSTYPRSGRVRAPARRCDAPPASRLPRPQLPRSPAASVGVRSRHARCFQRCGPELRRVARLPATFRLRPHDDDAPDGHERATDPHPHDEWIERDSDLGGLVAHARENDIGVPPRVRADADLGGGLERRTTLRIEVLALLALDQSDGLAV